jgi:hypothetical protein
MLRIRYVSRHIKSLDPGLRRDDSLKSINLKNAFAHQRESSIKRHGLFKKASLKNLCSPPKNVNLKLFIKNR